MNIAIIDYNCGNVKSVLFALNRLGYTATLTQDADCIKQADKVIFPGVGHAAFAMKELQKSGLDVLIKSLKQPVLGICLGMQLLCRYTEEGDTQALGVIPVDVCRFNLDAGLKVPQVGWNQLHDCRGALFANNATGYAYFVHSYYAALSPFTVAQCSYGHPFSAALQYQNFYATQFHPEKSASLGEQILSNFLKL